MPGVKERPRTVVLNVEIPSDLDEQFRKAIFERYGLKQGSIRRAVEDAIRRWAVGDVVSQATDMYRRPSGLLDKQRAVQILKQQGDKGFSALLALTRDLSLSQEDRSELGAIVDQELRWREDEGGSKNSSRSRRSSGSR